ncbi:MAG: AAA family ATPase [Cyanobacteriota bacterium]|jgi:MoxR-like ATPase
MNDDWQLFTNTNQARTDIDWEHDLPEPPSWRRFDQKTEERKRRFVAPPGTREVVNAALYLRRPLLITGKPGTGKSSLAYAIAYELGLGEVLKWPINTRSTLQEGLYRYDAIARLRESERQKPVGGKSQGGDMEEREEGEEREEREEREEKEDIGKFLQLGPLGTALIPRENEAERKKPRILLIDEIDKSDIDLPNDLLNVFEEGEFDIPELVRIKAQTDTVHVATFYRQEGEQRTYPVKDGKVQATTFPFVVMTSNGEREFPPAFLRRCLRLEMPNPNQEDLEKIVRQHLVDESQEFTEAMQALVTEFWQYQQRRERNLATDQLLNAIYLLVEQALPTDKTEDAQKKRKNLLDKLFESLGHF